MKFRKKPVVVEAYPVREAFNIETLEGTMHARPGDWLITGVNGEQYPCKADIFEKTYEPADTPPPSPWTLVSERLPDPVRSTRYLVTARNRPIVAVWDVVKKDWRLAGVLLEDVTRWMEIHE